MSYDNQHEISVLIGRTITVVRGLEVGSDCVVFECADGSWWRMVHDQDCCEKVSVADVVGDSADLIGTVIDAREEVGETDPEGYTPNEWRESHTWTFYIIQTDKGAVTIRWLGESNGYYSERVDFELVKEEAGRG